MDPAGHLLNPRRTHPHTDFFSFFLFFVSESGSAFWGLERFGAFLEVKTKERSKHHEHIFTKKSLSKAFYLLPKNRQQLTRAVLASGLV
jgi:hypothetical protein